MALGFTKNSGEDFLPSFRFNAVSGDAIVAWSEKDAAGEWEKKEKDVSFPVKFVFDFENIEVGWLHFSASGPNFSLVKLGNSLPQKPTPEHKQGFRVKMYNKEHGVCSFANSSRTIADVMDALHDEYLKGVKDNAGKVAVVEIRGVKKVSVKTKEGSKNYKQPECSIVAWVTKPEQLIEKVEAVQEKEEQEEEEF